MKKIQLGDTVKDPVTGYSGIAAGRTTWLNGCVRIGVQAKMRDGKVPELEWFDETQLVGPKLKKTQAAGGPQQDPTPRSEPRR